MAKPIRLAVLVSGGGTTLGNMIERIAAGSLDGEIAVVICSNPVAAEKVKTRFPGAKLVDRKTFDDAESFSQAVFQQVRSAGAELVCLGGFLCLLSIPPDFAGKVLNIHPALLPSFGGRGMFGRRVHEAVIAHGCKVSGCTVHFADATYDTGPILVQRVCEVLDHDTADTLAARVFEQECQAYPEAIQLIADGRVRIEGRVARIVEP